MNSKLTETERAAEAKWKEVAKEKEIYNDSLLPAEEAGDDAAEKNGDPAHPAGGPPHAG